MNALHEYDDYRDYLSDYFNNDSEGKKNKSTLASLLGKDNYYLTKVLKKEAHLHPEEAFKVGQHFKFNEREIKLIITQSHLSAVTSPELLQHFQNEINAIRTELLRVSRDEFANSKPLIINYHAFWFYPAIHALCKLPQFRNIEILAKKLSFTKDYLQRLVNNLSRWGLIDNKNSEMASRNYHIDLPQTSPIYLSHLITWRREGLVSLYNKNHHHMHETRLCLLTPEQVEKLKSNMYQTLREFHEHNSTFSHEIEPETDLYCINVDVFNYGEQV